MSFRLFLSSWQKCNKMWHVWTENSRGINKFCAWGEQFILENIFRQERKPSQKKFPNESRCICINTAPNSIFIAYLLAKLEFCQQGLPSSSCKTCSGSTQSCALPVGRLQRSNCASEDKGVPTNNGEVMAGAKLSGGGWNRVRKEVCWEMKWSGTWHGRLAPGTIPFFTSQHVPFPFSDMQVRGNPLWSRRLKGRQGEICSLTCPICPPQDATQSFLA